MLHDPFRQSAAIAYYTLFSLPSLLVVIIALAGYFWDQSTVQDQLIQQLADVVGADTAESIEKLISNVDIDDGSIVALAISLGVLIFGATGAFFQLKKTMNTIWSVNEKKSGVVMMVLDRFLSLGLILVIGFMMIISLVITALITALGGYISEFSPDISAAALRGFNLLFSYLFIGFLFTAIFKLLPDVKLKWRHAFVGASLTTILFLVAEYGLSFYFKQSNPASVFGGASSIILIMLWVYYSCLILFFGAEFTVQYTLHKGEKIVPNRFGEPAYLQKLEEAEKEKEILKSDKVHDQKNKSTQ